MQLLTAEIKSKKCKKFKVACKNNVEQEDKRPTSVLLWLSPTT